MKAQIVMILQVEMDHPMNYEFVQRIRNIIQNDNEDEQIDFKQEWHSDNERLLHDILCFANTVHNLDCFIIIGVSDDKKIIGVSNINRKKQADLLDMLANINFAGDYTPKVSVDTLSYGDKDIDILTIHNSLEVPFYIKKKPNGYKYIQEGFIYVRRGDKNTPMCQNASLPDIEMLWKKRLGLTLPPLEQICKRLENKLEWTSGMEGYYNAYKPEFQLIYDHDDEDVHLKGEFYVYTQMNSSFSYNNIKIMFNTTVLSRFQLISLDSGRYTTPVPDWEYLGRDEHMKPLYIYKYYLKDSFCYQLQQFLYDEDNSEEVYAKERFDEVILYFDNSVEKESFEAFVLASEDSMSKYFEEAESYYFTIDSGNEMLNKESKRRLSFGLALNKALKQYRNG